MRSATAPDTTTSALPGPRSHCVPSGVLVTTQPSAEPGRNLIRWPRPRCPALPKAGADSRSMVSLSTSAASRRRSRTRCRSRTPRRSGGRITEGEPRRWWYGFPHQPDRLGLAGPAPPLARGLGEAPPPNSPAPRCMDPRYGPLVGRGQRDGKISLTGSSHRRARICHTVFRPRAGAAYEPGEPGGGTRCSNPCRRARSDDRHPSTPSGRMSQKPEKPEIEVPCPTPLTAAPSQPDVAVRSPCQQA